MKRALILRAARVAGWVSRWLHSAAYKWDDIDLWLCNRYWDCQ